jgi:hypothetical protein
MYYLPSILIQADPLWIGLGFFEGDDAEVVLLHYREALCSDGAEEYICESGILV